MSLCAKIYFDVYLDLTGGMKRGLYIEMAQRFLPRILEDIRHPASRDGNSICCNVEYGILVYRYIFLSMGQGGNIEEENHCRRILLSETWRIYFPFWGSPEDHLAVWTSEEDRLEFKDDNGMWLRAVKRKSAPQIYECT
jgi:hypothetical protein